MFKSSRYFSIARLIGAIAVVTALSVFAVVTALSVFYRNVAVGTLTARETEANVVLARAVANSVWTKYASFLKDVSHMSEAERRQRREIGRLRADVVEQMKGLTAVAVKIYDTNGLTVFSTDARQIGQYVRHNPGFRRALGGEIASGITFRNGFDAFDKVIVDRDLVSSYIPIWKNGTAVEGVFELYSDVTGLVQDLKKTQRQIVVGGSLAFSSLYAFLFLIVARAGNIIKVQEEARRTIEAEVHRQAYHDSLTGLLNRTSFAEHMRKATDRAKRSQKLLGLMFLDIDRFKVVNDSLGHNAGDQLLQVTAKRIQSGARGSDMVFRMGGDEFTVILENLQSPEDAALVGPRIIESMARPIKLGEHELIVTVSMGIALYPTDATDPEGLVKHADTAMYRAKEVGGNTYVFYTGT
jgi:diguanylate cyclase (GGDEF)-like protein